MTRDLMKINIQAASFYTSRFGFEPLCYRGLETGSRKIASHAVKQNKVKKNNFSKISSPNPLGATQASNSLIFQIIFVFESAYEPDNHEMSTHLARHGDGVRDVAFTVEDIEIIVEVAKKRGAEIVRDIWEEKDDYGVVKMATIKTVMTH